MSYRILIASLVLLIGCGKPVQFDRVPEDPEKVIRDYNCGVFGCVTIVSHSTLDVKYLTMTLDNHRRYAKKFNFDYIFRNNLVTTKFVDEYAKGRVFQLGLYWQKIAAIQEAMDEKIGDERRYAWILWIDPDAVFTNFDISLETIINEHAGDFAHPESYFLASKEPFTLINAGVLLFHNNEWSRNMIQTISDAHPWYAHQLLPEQEAIQDFIAGFLTRAGNGGFSIKPMMERDYKAANRIIPGAKVLTQRALNSFYGGWCPWACSEQEVWQPGDFISHFAVVKDKFKDISHLLGCFKEGGDNYHEGDAYKSCR